MTDVYIGLGSNLSNPLRQVQQGLDALSRLPHTILKTRSNIYTTRPIGLLEQPDFFNAVCQLETSLSPEALLDALLTIERKQLRIRGPEKNGPRTLDLDILIYGKHQILTQRLEIPHPRLTERAFVVVPLMEIAPKLVLNDNLKLADVAKSGQIVKQGIVMHLYAES
ncbi:MAG: folK [Gammaproteobacteria bacterium]|nr:folK [Gammaproteobacteria bacterium]